VLAQQASGKQTPTSVPFPIALQIYKQLLIGCIYIGGFGSEVLGYFNFCCLFF
jgi:hypothetical protein